MKKLIKQAAALLLCAVLLCPAVYAAETAANIQLTKTEGTVTVSKSNGKSVSMRANMRLYNGYNVTTAEKSYAWINLDSTKLMKLDASSSVEVRKNGSKLEVNVKSGSVSFDVSEKLSSGESLNVSTSTMSVGIRGTCGWARVTDQWVSEICLLEGSSQCVVMDPVSCQIKSAQLNGGDTAQCVVYSQDRPGDKCDILMERQSTENIPGFVLTELVQNVELCDKILDDSGLDVLADLAKEAGGDPSGRSPDGKSASVEVIGKAEQVRSSEEAEMAQKQEEIRKEEEQQEHNISKEPVWEQGQQPSDTGSSGSSSGGSTGTPPAQGTYTVTFDLNGGTSEQPPFATTNTNGTVAFPTEPANDTPRPESNTGAKYVFDGWYTSAEGGEQVTGSTKFTRNTTIYAHWKLDKWDWELTGTDLRIYGTGDMDDYTSSVPAPWGTGITSVNIEDGITNIGNSAFKDCYSLSSVTIQDSVTSIGDSTFQMCSSLTSVTIPNKVTSIGDSAFYECRLLTSVTIPNSVTSIGLHAFHNCQGLTGITIPNSVKTIDDSAFQGCTGLTSIDFSGTTEQWLAITKGDNAIPANVTAIHCTNGDFPCTVTFDANGGTVATASATTDTSGKLASLPTPTRTANAGEYATYTFDGWYDAETGGTQIDVDTAFTTDTTVYAYWTVSGWDWEYINESNTLRIFGNGQMDDFDAGGSVSVAVPWKENAKNVKILIIEDGITSVGSNLFYSYHWSYSGSSLLSVTIPASVTIIHSEAFQSCTNLTDIHFSGTKADWNNIGYTAPSGVTITCTDGEITIP